MPKVNDSSKGFFKRFLEKAKEKNKLKEANKKHKLFLKLDEKLSNGKLYANEQQKYLSLKKELEELKKMSKYKLENGKIVVNETKADVATEQGQESQAQPSEVSQMPREQAMQQAPMQQAPMQQHEQIHRDMQMPQEPVQITEEEMRRQDMLAQEARSRMQRAPTREEVEAYNQRKALFEARQKNARMQAAWEQQQVNLAQQNNEQAEEVEDMQMQYGESQSEDHGTQARHVEYLRQQALEQQALEQQARQQQAMQQQAMQQQAMQQQALNQRRAAMQQQAAAMQQQNIPQDRIIKIQLYVRDMPLLETRIRLSQLADFHNEFTKARLENLNFEFQKFVIAGDKLIAFTFSEINNE